MFLKNTLKTEKTFFKTTAVQTAAQILQSVSWHSEGFTSLSQKPLITDKTHSCKDPALQRWLTSGQAAAQTVLSQARALLGIYNQL